MTPNETEMLDQIAKAEVCTSEGRSDVPGMSYEEGVSAALRWAIGESDDEPIGDPS